MVARKRNEIQSSMRKIGAQVFNPTDESKAEESPSKSIGDSTKDGDTQGTNPSTSTDTSTEEGTKKSTIAGASTKKGVGDAPMITIKEQKSLRDRKLQRTYYLDPSLVEELDAFSEYTGMPKYDVMEQALEKFFEKVELAEPGKDEARRWREVRS